MTKFDLTASWQEIHAGVLTNVVLQASNNCLIYIGGAAAPVEDPSIGIKLQSDGRSGLVFTATDMTVKIWAKRLEGFESSISYAGW